MERTKETKPTFQNENNETNLKICKLTWKSMQLIIFTTNNLKITQWTEKVLKITLFHEKYTW